MCLFAGYVSALHGEAQESLRRFFVESDVSLVGVDANSKTEATAAFSTMPNARAQAIALLRLLKKMQWEFVTVVLSEQVRLRPETGQCTIAGWRFAGFIRRIRAIVH